MEPVNEDMIEELIDRELRKLPDLAAPPTLVHRVMLAVHADAEKPWWGKSWFYWPRPVQFLSLAALVMLAGLSAYVAGAAWEGLGVSSLPTVAREWLASWAGVWELLAGLFNTAAVLLRVGGKEILLFGAILGLFYYAACVGLGTLCYRVAFRRDHR